MCRAKEISPAMPDLLASTSLLPPMPAVAPRTASIAVPAVADFMAVLGELILPPGAKPQGGKGQALAGDGKNLPVEGESSAGEQDEDDPLAAWFPVGLIPLQPVEPVPVNDSAPAAVSLPAGEASAAAAPLADTVLPIGLTDAGGTAPFAAGDPPTGALLSGAGAPVAVSPPEAPSAEVVEGEAVIPQMLDASPEASPRAKAEMPVRESLVRPASAHSAIPQPVVPGVNPAPTAAQVFAAAISATFESPAAPRAADPVIVQAQSAATEQLRTTVQAMSGADQPPLDLSRDDWAGKMVDRIATLRDAAEAADTRIRLAPENLGNVDVSIRRDGDRLHVHFAAENPATRQLLAEAAPRLAELADARGVKLGQTSVDAGTGGQQQGQAHQPRPNPAERPASAVAHVSQSDRDDRVA